MPVSGDICEERNKNTCESIEDISIIFKNKLHHHKKRKKIRLFTYRKRALQAPLCNDFKRNDRLSQPSSMPYLKDLPKTTKPNVRSSDTTICKAEQPYSSKYIANFVSNHRNKQCVFGRSPVQASFRVYRCQISTAEESCCCACNSDAMFDVMKSLYDCYKRKNCDKCDCILCGHLPREERLQGEMRKEFKMQAIGTETELTEGEKLMKKVKTEKIEKQFAGKTLAEKEAKLKEMAASGTPLPELKSVSEKGLLKKVKMDMGLPPEPKTAAEKEKLKKAEAAGAIVPLEGKTQAQKKKILKMQADLGIVLPEGRTASEKKLIDEIKSGVKEKPSDKTQTEVSRKLKEQKEEVHKKLPTKAELLTKKKIEPKIPPVEGKIPSDKAIGIKKQVDDKKLPSPAAKAEQLKEVKILPQPKSLKVISKVKAEVSPPVGKVKVKETEISLEKKKSDQKEKMLRNLVKQQLPLPEAKTPSGKRLLSKVRADVGLPPEPNTVDKKEKYAKAQAAGIIVPLEGKTAAEKEKILDKEYEAGIPLPEGRTPSEKEFIKKFKASKIKSKALSEKAQKLENRTSKVMKEGKGPSDECICDILAPVIETEKALLSKKLSEKLRKAKAEGFMTPLEGKSPEQKEKILRGLAKHGVPLPEAKSASDKKLIQKIRTDIGLPPEPKTSALKQKYANAQAAGIITPLEGKSAAQKEKILKALSAVGLPLPEGRRASEKALISKIKAEGLSRKPSLEGKSLEQKEKIIKDLVQKGRSLPEVKSASERKLIDKVKVDMGLPPEPKTVATKEKYEKARVAGIIQPLEGKTHKEKEDILIQEYEAGISLPAPRTISETEIITRIIKTKGRPRELSKQAKKLDDKTSKVMKEGKGPSDECICSLLMPEYKKPISLLASISSAFFEKLPGQKPKFEGKSREQKEKMIKDMVKKGKPLPPVKTISDKKLVDKVRVEMGLPPEPKLSEKYAKAQAAGLVSPLEGKRAPSRVPSEKVKARKRKIKQPPVSPSVSEKIRKARAAGFAPPTLEDKTPDEMEELLKKLIKQQIPLPESQTIEEERVVRRVRYDAGLPPEPINIVMKKKHEKAYSDGIIVPLEGKSHAEKEKILMREYEAGISLPKPRTSSEKEIIKKIKATRPQSKILSDEEVKKLEKKSSKSIKEGKGPSDECICSLLTPESEKKSSEFVKKELSPATKKISEKIRKAKDAGLLTPLEGKTPEQKEKIIKGLVKHGVPLPEGKTVSDKRIIHKVITDMGMPPEPKTMVLKEKYAIAQAAGIITPLEGKTTAQKEKILRALTEAGLPLPEARMASEKALITKLKAEKSISARKEKELRDLLQKDKLLSQDITESEKKLKDKIRAEKGLPQEAKPSESKEKYKKLDKRTSKNMKEAKGPSDECICGLLTPESEKTPSKRLSVTAKPTAKAIEKGLPPSTKPTEKIRKAKIAEPPSPLQGKSPDQKEKLLKDMVKHGKPLPEVKSASDKKLIDKVRADMGLPPEPKTSVSREKYAKAQAAGIITPLNGKSPAQKEKILKALSAAGLPLPEGHMPSEKTLIDKVKGERSPALPPEPTKLKDKVDKGLPLEAKSSELKKKYKKLDQNTSKNMKEGSKSDECICGLLTPESEKISSKPSSLTGKGPTKGVEKAEKKRKAKSEDLNTQLEGKTRNEKEKILKDALKQGKPLPEAKSASDKKLIEKVKADMESSKIKKIADSKVIKAEEAAKLEAEKLRKAKPIKKTFPEKGPSARPSIVRSLTQRTPSQKEKKSKGLADARLERKAVSEKSLIKARATKQKTRKTGEGAKAMKAAKEISVAAGAKRGGVAEKFEEITKSTTCDQGCGCDTRKIRFKHSYVKIMVTSPDISTLCPCPNDCIPRTKEGVFVDNDGIKVTIGSALGVPSFRTNCKNKNCYYNQSAPEIKENCNILQSDMSSIDFISDNNISEIYVKSEHVKCLHKRNGFYSSSEESLGTGSHSYESDDNIWGYILNNRNKKSSISNKSSASRYLITCSEHYGTPLTVSWSSINQLVYKTSVKSSRVLLVGKTNSSLSNSSKFSTGIETISVTSFRESKVISSTSCEFWRYPKSNTSAIHDEESEYLTSTIIDNPILHPGSKDDDLYLQTSDKNYMTLEKNTRKDLYDVVILRIDTHMQSMAVAIDEILEDNVADPIAVIKDVNSEFDITKVIEAVIAKEKFISKSSIMVLLPFAGENYHCISDTASSTICIRLSENILRTNGMPLKKINDTLCPYRGLKIEVKGKLFDMYGQQTSQTDFDYEDTNNTQIRDTNNGQFRAQNDIGVLKCESIIDYENFSMDTTQDRPCCCSPTQSNCSDQFDANNKYVQVISSHNIRTSNRKVVFGDPQFQNNQSKHCSDKCGGPSATCPRYRRHLYCMDITHHNNCNCLKNDVPVNFNSGNSVVSEIIAPLITSQNMEQGFREYVCYQNEQGSKEPDQNEKCLSRSQASPFNSAQCVVYQAKRSKRKEECGGSDACPCAAHVGSFPADPTVALPNAPPCGHVCFSPDSHTQHKCVCAPEITSNKMDSVAVGGSGPICCPKPCTTKITHLHSLSVGHKDVECTCQPPQSPCNSTGIVIRILKDRGCQVPINNRPKPKAPAPLNPTSTQPSTRACAIDFACQNDTMCQNTCCHSTRKQPDPPNITRGSFGCQFDTKSKSVSKKKRKKTQCECNVIQECNVQYKNVKAFLESNCDKDPIKNKTSDMARPIDGAKANLGFNVKFIKRPPPPPPRPVEVDMSFEDALAYFEEIEPECVDKKCKKKKKKDIVECECPYIIEIPCDPPCESSFEDPKGLKIKYGRKGSP